MTHIVPVMVPVVVVVAGVRLNGTAHEIETTKLLLKTAVRAASMSLAVVAFDTVRASITACKLASITVIVKSCVKLVVAVSPFTTVALTVTVPAANGRFNILPLVMTGAFVII